MTKTLEATFDGTVFRPDGPVELQPNTRVQIVVTVKPGLENSHSIPPLEAEPFVGMWSDREDMSDSSAWVRDVRESHWVK